MTPFRDNFKKNIKPRRCKLVLLILKWVVKKLWTISCAKSQKKWGNSRKTSSSMLSSLKRTWLTLLNRWASSLRQRCFIISIFHLVLLRKFLKRSAPNKHISYNHLLAKTHGLNTCLRANHSSRAQLLLINRTFSRIYHDSFNNLSKCLVANPQTLLSPCTVVKRNWAILAFGSNLVVLAGFPSTHILRMDSTRPANHLHCVTQ